MGRVISGTLASILSPAKRELDYTVDIVFPDATSFHFGTSPLTSVNGHNYTNDIESIGEIRQTLESPTDRVAIAIQNKDRVLGQHVAAFWQLWRTATAVVGRYYYQIGDDGLRTGTNEWIEIFRGGIQRPNANDKQVTFDLIPDTTSPGQIVCTHTEAVNCTWVYKDPRTCGYSGGLTSCDHTLKGVNGCDVHANSHRYGGTEHRYKTDLSIPGTGGSGGGGGGGTGCPRLDQYVRVKGPDGKIIAKMVCFFTEEDELWDPIDRQFYETETARIVRNQPIWEMVAANGAVNFSSFSHLVMPHEDHETGLSAFKISANDETLTEIMADSSVELRPSYAVLSQSTGESGDVMYIKMKGGHRYASGDSPEKMFVDHNNKPPPLD